MVGILEIIVRLAVLQRALDIFDDLNGFFAPGVAAQKADKMFDSFEIIGS